MPSPHLHQLFLDNLKSGGAHALDAYSLIITFMPLYVYLLNPASLLMLMHGPQPAAL